LYKRDKPLKGVQFRALKSAASVRRRKMSSRGRDAESAQQSSVAVPIGRYVFDFASSEGSFALFEPQAETRNASGVAEALASEDEAPAGVPALEEFVEDASTVTARGESCVGLFNAIAQGEALDPKVVSQEIDALLGLLGRLDRAGRHKEALRVARDLAALLALFLRWLDLVQSLELALRTARKIGDSEAEAWALHELGSLHLAAGDPTAAAQHLNDALSLRDKGGGYGRCVTRHNLDAARRDSADVDAVTRAQRRHRFRLVGGSALLALLATGGIALAVTTGHRSTGPTSSSTQAISTTETSTASTTHPPTTTRSTTTRSTIGSGTTGTGTSSTTSVTDTTDPQITLTTPPSDSFISDNTPTFSGQAGTESGDKPTVTISIFSGNSAVGTPVHSPLQAPRDAAGQYSVDVAATDPLSDGVYAVVAQQRDDAGHVGSATPVTFTIDTAQPALTLTSPKRGAITSQTPSFGGSIGTAAGDIESVKLEVFKSPDGPTIETPRATVANGAWQANSTTLLDVLPKGQSYTARAEQTDQTGNTSTVSVTFVVVATPK
jgi:hypothetical protein